MPESVGAQQLVTGRPGVAVHSVYSSDFMPKTELLQFPCELPIKVFVNNEPGSREAAVAIIRAHYSELDDRNVTERLSKGGRFVSLTVRIHAESREQVDAVYRELTESKEVLMAL